MVFLLTFINVTVLAAVFGGISGLIARPAFPVELAGD